jgi:hypothetical protein
MADRREVQLAAYRRLLNSADGEAMMAELRVAWEDINPIDPCPATMGFNVGLQQAYKQLKQWKDMEPSSNE